MGRAIISLGTGLLAIAFLGLSIDSWLYAGHFLHFGQAAHITVNGTAVADGWTEFFFGLVALSVSNSASPAGNHFTSACVSLMGLFLLALAAGVFFKVGVLPALIIPAHAEPVMMGIAGLLACSVGYDLAPGSWRRKSAPSSKEKSAK